MNSRAHNLALASRLIRRIGDADAFSEFEGVPLRELAADCAAASYEIRMAALREEILMGPRVSNVIDLHTYSRRVGA